MTDDPFALGATDRALELLRDPDRDPDAPFTDEERELIEEVQTGIAQVRRTLEALAAEALSREQAEREADAAKARRRAERISAVRSVALWLARAGIPGGPAGGGVPRDAGVTPWAEVLAVV